MSKSHMLIKKLLAARTTLPLGMPKGALAVAEPPHAEALRVLRVSLDRATDAVLAAFGRLAEITEGGRTLDDHQIPAFKLATLRAELLAAQAYLDHVEAQRSNGGISARDLRLSAIYAAEILLEVDGWFTVHADELKVRVPSWYWQVSPELHGFLWADSYKSAADLLRAEGPRDRKLFSKGIAEAAGMIWETAQKFVAEKVRPVANRIFWSQETMPREWIEVMARDLGVWGTEQFADPAHPELVPVLRMLTSEALAEGMFGGPGSLPTRNYITVEAIDAAYTNRDGTKREMPEHIAQLRTRLTSMDPTDLLLSAIAHSEPNAGSDSANIAVTAKLSEDGGYYVINGEKQWCTAYKMSDGLFLTARTDARSTGHKGISLFWVPKESDALEEDGSAQGSGPTAGKMVGKKDRLICYRGMGGTCTVSFEDFKLDKKWLIGELNQGWVPLMKGLSSGRLQTAARSVGLAQSALEIAAQYASTRHQFGRPIGEFPEIQMKLARMAAKVQAARQLAYLAAQGDIGDPDLSASIAKLVATSAAFEVANEAVQIHGGMGVSEESDVSRMFLDARLLGIFEGTTEIQKLIIARAMIRQAGSRT